MSIVSVSLFGYQVASSRDKQFVGRFLCPKHDAVIALLKNLMHRRRSPPRQLTVRIDERDPKAPSDLGAPRYVSTMHVTGVILPDFLNASTLREHFLAYVETTKLVIMHTSLASRFRTQCAIKGHRQLSASSHVDEIEMPALLNRVAVTLSPQPQVPTSPALGVLSTAAGSPGEPAKRSGKIRLGSIRDDRSVANWWWQVDELA